MATQFYLPKKDEDKKTWLNTFAAKLPSHAANLSVSAAEITSVQNDAAALVYWLGNIDLFATEKEERVQYKNILRDGPIGTPGGVVPSTPTPPAPPATVLPGIFPRVTTLIGRIKKSPNYNDSIGKDLGIIGAEQVIDTVSMKPKLKLVLKGGQVEVQWQKGDADAIRIEKSVGTGAFVFVAVDTEPHYVDTTVFPATPVTWRYRAIYLMSDHPVGQWSDVASITVGA